MKEALLYKKLDDKRVQCYLCAHHCIIKDNDFGFCAVRQNKDGVLYTYTYGKLVAAQVDPIEKKPLYHFLPGSKSFSIATLGCNFRCGFCQNWQISQADAKQVNASIGEDYSPAQIVDAAVKSKCKSISYTYTEPTIFFELALDTAKIAQNKGLSNIFVTNGFMSSECLQMIAPYLDAANVDLKFFNEESYKKICSGRLSVVLDSIRLMHKLGIWVELTTLVIPGENDSQQELDGIAGFISEVDKNIPWHISRFHPDYKFRQKTSTPEDSIKMAQGLGKKHKLNYVYAGNVTGWGSDTYCPECSKLLIAREGFSVVSNNIKDSKCEFCSYVIAGRF